ncbi:ATP-binding protein [Herbivorax sp. ANBcel31]|uniref:ATP-binding protein n=1 Tax=Herbivorax sp. ANBcel31 TaxID=3069754 RepID=UPI0027B2B75C|nr:ATP-binding protein [Herbivorax sp. ANBcel31]MDQ2085685.1 ATP-binding protein [Herbivorax sp. ANBcel31]
MQILKYTLEAFIPFDKDSIEKFLFLCEETINNLTSDEKIIFKLKSATHELLINSLEHGYGKNSGKVSFSMQKTKHSILLEMTDEGSGLNPSILNLENQCKDLNSIKDRGWGLMILNKLSDNMVIASNKPKGTKISVFISV